MHTKAERSTPHTSHCLGSGQVMISTMGDTKNGPRGQYYSFSTVVSVLQVQYYTQSSSLDWYYTCNRVYNLTLVVLHVPTFIWLSNAWQVL